MNSAKIVLHSRSEAGKSLITYKLRYPKFIHGEFMTHRMFSRNASSSRAIPTAKLLQEVRDDALRASPEFWGKNQPGMSAVQELSSTIPCMEGSSVSEKDFAKSLWRASALDAAAYAEALLKGGVHKQIVNRILEPYSHINVLVSATEWDNFFGLRLHKDAQPEMRMLAEEMWECLLASKPTTLKEGEWHLPFVDEIARKAVFDYTTDPKASYDTNYEFFKETCAKVSVARCARVSYESFETGKLSTIEEDLRLFERLTAGLTDPSQPLHASPMEHQATPDRWWDGSALKAKGWMADTLHGNFVGWVQYRKLLPNEAVAPFPKEYDGT